jgi:putative transposase
MPNYRRASVPGGVYFLTLVTYRRIPIFRDPANVISLRRALSQVRREQPFDVVAAVVLPDHMHFLWALPRGDAGFSSRVGRMKILFTRSFARRPDPAEESRRRHRERAVWQRRFWERSVIDERELEAYLDYIHHNPVKHGYVSCPHLWPASSFGKWVAHGHYPEDWGCVCGGRTPPIPGLERLDRLVGE